MNSQPTIAPFDRAQALRIVNALRQGSNVLEGVTLFSAGRDSIVHAASELLEELTLSGGSAVRWLRGSYGSGKTHTFARIRDAAQHRRWVVSYVVVSGRSQGCEFHRFHEVYAGIVRNCALPNGNGAGEGPNGWEQVLDDWVGSLKRQAGAKPGGDVPFFRVADALRATVSALATSFGIHGSYLAALNAYANARLENDVERTRHFLEWFAGTDVLRQSPLLKKALRADGILESISQKNAKLMLRQMTAFLRYRGFSGLLVLFDEVENVLHLPPSSRRSAYTIARELIDNVDAISGMTQTLLYFSGTPDLFDSDKGVGEYEALASRILMPPDDAHPNPAASVISLEDFPVTHGDMLAMSTKIAALYAVAYPGRRASLRPDELSSRLARPPFPSPRLWVRSIVDELDRANGQR